MASKNEEAKQGDKEPSNSKTAAGPTSVPAGTDVKPKRTRRPSQPKADGLTQEDLRAFETYLTNDIDSKKAEATDDQLETWFASRKRVRDMMTSATPTSGGVAS